METKEIKIQVPEGYEIDKENSTFKCIKFKPIEKYITYEDVTYEDVCNTIFVNDTYFITDHGDVYKDAYAKWDGGIIPDKNIATNEKQLKKILALNQLLNIAEYYNQLHTTGSNTYTIRYDKIDKIYYTTTTSITHLCGIKAFFNRKEDAQAVINNPNFREILDTIYR